MSYDYKKCTFVKMSGKGRNVGRKKNKLKVSDIKNQKTKILKEWRDSWFKGEYESKR